jgi:hypothetical protein
MPALESVGGLAGVSRPLTEPPAPMQPKESAIPSMARVLLHSRHCILTEPRMRRSSTGDSCADYAWPCTLRLRVHLDRYSDEIYSRLSLQRDRERRVIVGFGAPYITLSLLYNASEEAIESVLELPRSRTLQAWTNSGSNVGSTGTLASHGLCSISTPSRT